MDESGWRVQWRAAGATDYPCGRYKRDLRPVRAISILTAHYVWATVVRKLNCRIAVRSFSQTQGAARHLTYTSFGRQTKRKRMVRGTPGASFLGLIVVGFAETAGRQHQ